MPGGNQKAEVNTEVKLDGGKSSDDDGKIVSYKWEQTDGPKVDLKQPDEETATFDVPESAADSKLTFKLTVVDDKDASNSDDVNVEVGKISRKCLVPKTHQLKANQINFYFFVNTISYCQILHHEQRLILKQNANINDRSDMIM